MNQYRIAFVIEQTLGHATHAANLRVNVPKDKAVDAQWLDIPFETYGLAAQMPVYKSNWTVRAGWRTRRALAAAQRRAPLDALFFHTAVVAVGAADWLERIPSVVSLDATPLQYDGLGEFYGHARGPAWFESFKRRRYEACFRAARSLVTWSAWTKQGLVQAYRVPAEKVFVIPPGVITLEWKRPTPRRQDTRPVKILFVGGDFRRKGGNELLEAFRTLSPLGVELHIVTREKVAAEPGVIVYNHLTPNSAALKQIYHACDIFCLPTYGDFSPMALAEAGAAGLPLVSTNIAAIPELVQAGVNGLLVSPGDVDGLAQALARLVQNPELRLGMGECAAEFVAQKWDAERNTIQLLELIKQPVQTPTRG